MKIAIPSNDRSSISKHFGKSKGFVICEVENNEVVNKKYIENSFTGHARGKHAEHTHTHNHQHGHGNHNHNKIISGIGDCDTVIAGGMGRRLYNDFKANKMNVFVTQETKIDKAIELLLANKLDNNTDSCCNH